MIRFIIKRRMRTDDCVSEGYETVDIDVPELQRILLGGGSSQYGYDVRDLHGVEILPDEEKSSKVIK